MTPNTHVRLTHLTSSFHEGEHLHAVLQSLDATFIRGENVALKGRSGSGKSTLLNLISGIDVPDDGEVEIDGHLVTAMSERDRTLFGRKHIGFVYQTFNLVPTLTVADNVRLVLELNAAKGDTVVRGTVYFSPHTCLFDRKPQRDM
jgi:putative ABC transport system ATP-binding protein